MAFFLLIWLHSFIEITSILDKYYPMGIIQLKGIIESSTISYIVKEIDLKF